MCLAGLQRFSLVALLCTYLHMYVCICDMYARLAVDFPAEPTLTCVHKYVLWGLLPNYLPCIQEPPGCLPATRPSAAACPPPTAHLNFLALRHGDPPLKQSSLVQNSLGIHWLTTASSNKIQLPKGFCPGCILLAVVYTRVPQNHQQGSELLELLLVQDNSAPSRRTRKIVGLLRPTFPYSCPTLP